MRKSKLLLFLIVAAFLLCSCSRSKKEQNEPDPIEIGAVLPITGVHADIAKSCENGLKLCFDEINKKRGINGRKVKLIIKDDKSIVDETSTELLKLTTKTNLAAIVGSPFSGSNEAISKVAANSRILTVIPGDYEELFSDENKQYAYSVAMGNVFQGQAMARYAFLKLNIKNAAVVYNEENKCSESMAASFKKEFERYGGSVNLYLANKYYTTDFSDFAKLVKNKSPQAVYIPESYHLAGKIIKEFKSTGINTLYLGDNEWENEAFIKAFPGEGSDAYYSSDYFSGDVTPLNKEFKEKYEEKYQKVPDSFAALAYDAGKVITECLKKVNYSDYTKLSDEIRSLNIQGVTGELKFTEGKILKKSANIIQIKNNEPVFKDKVNP